jgi:CheY-like chemotaxis protein
MSATSDTIRVLLADDHPALRAGIRAILEKAPDVQVVGEAKDGTQAQQLTASLRPQVLLLDLRMPGPRPAETVAWVRAHCPDTAVLVLTAHDVDGYLAAMVEVGAAGFVVKEEAPETIVEAVRAAARGEVFFSEEQRARARHWHEEVGARWESGQGGSAGDHRGGRAGGGAGRSVLQRGATGAGAPLARGGGRALGEPDRTGTGGTAVVGRGVG